LPARLINPERKLSTTSQDFIILGPTCDTVDILPEPFHLPDDADEGDWIEIAQAGAYTNVAATRFNGFYPETFVSVDAPPLLPTA
jgi:ornithine decarboxylase